MHFEVEQLTILKCTTKGRFLVSHWISLRIIQSPFSTRKNVQPGVFAACCTVLGNADGYFDYLHSTGSMGRSRHFVPRVPARYVLQTLDEVVLH